MSLLHFMLYHSQTFIIPFPITKTCLFKYIENLIAKNGKFSDKKFWYLLYIPAQNIDCGYALELFQQGSSNKYPQSMFLAK